MKSILVVDDDRMNLTLAQSILSEEYKVIAVNSGKLAYAYLSRFIPDLILLDIMMPEISGFDVMHTIKKTEAWKNIPVIFLTAERGADTESSCFDEGAVDFVFKPFTPKAVLSRIRRTLELEEYRKNLEEIAREQAGKIVEQSNKLIAIQQEVIVSMANLIESRDGCTGGHVKRTSKYVKILALELKKMGFFKEELTDTYISTLYKAAPMHDIGKIIVPDYILKSKEKLTTEEFKIMQGHSAAGADIIQKNIGKIEEQKYIEIAVNMAHYHHERWNGNGYPKGLKGNEIPLAARIMAFADVFDALTSERRYKPKNSIEESFAIIEDEKGKQFDPVITEVFLSIKPILADMVRSEN
ncbi:MAG: response regulator [Acetivibrio sp.]